jgi:hypothetical protein
MTLKAPKEKLNEKLENWIEEKPKISKILRKIQNPYWDMRNTEKFFEEVNQHIKCLKEFEKEYGHLNERILEKDENNLKIWQRNYLKKRYSKNYCPAIGFPSGFSKSERIRYIILRVEIDRLLNIKNNVYTI